MRPLPSIHRVIPTQSAVKSEWILPYDKLREMIASGNTFRVNNCICRTKQDLEDKRECTFPFRNVAQGVNYVCNCCGCCCGILRGINEFGIDKSVAAANYFSVIDPEKCVGCGTCTERCQMHAVSTVNDIAIVNREKCIGGGLCVSGCRLVNRGLQV